MTKVTNRVLILICALLYVIVCVSVYNQIRPSLGEREYLSSDEFEILDESGEVLEIPYNYYEMIRSCQMSSSGDNIAWWLGLIIVTGFLFNSLVYLLSYKYKVTTSAVRDEKRIKPEKEPHPEMVSLIASGLILGGFTISIYRITGPELYVFIPLLGCMIQNGFALFAYLKYVRKNCHKQKLEVV